MVLKNEQSYWAILYFVVQWVRYFILIGAIRRTSPLTKGDWGGFVEYWFPKWHPDPEDKSILDTILREIQEETGIGSDQLFLESFDKEKPAFSLSYEIVKKGEKILKTSTYYAIEMKKIDLLTELEVPWDFIHEIRDIRIVAENQVDDILSHNNEKLLLQWRLDTQEKKL